MNDSAICLQGLIKPKNDRSYCFWKQKVWHPDLTLLRLSVLSKTVENESLFKNGTCWISCKKHM